MNTSRRQFLRNLGISSAALPFLDGLPSFAAPSKLKKSPQRLIFMFSPNGTIPKEFWPDKEGESFELKRILKPLESFKDRLITLNGISNKIRGDGDSHMRGMSCLLSAKELFPGNIQGGSHTPAGWCQGISIDEEIANYFQTKQETKTRFGNLTTGVAVPHRADPWTRWVYAGPNKPVAPNDDPYKLLNQLYGRLEDQESVKSILDDLRGDLKKAKTIVSNEDRHLIDSHEALIRDLEVEMESLSKQKLAHPVPDLSPGVVLNNDSIPEISRMQIELLVNAFANDMARVASLQYTNSVGNARMTWLGIKEGHHALSHDPDLNTQSQEKLTKINVWYAEQMALLCQKLDSIPEPGHSGSLLDHTTVIWTNELGKGNSHTLNDIPFVAVGGGLGFKAGRALNFKRQPHNRLWLSLAHAVGHQIPTFGNPQLSENGPFDLS